MYIEKYLDYKQFSIEDARLILANILSYQYTVQPIFGNKECHIDEQWKLISYDNIKPNMYEISNYSRIRNVHSGRILSQVQNSNGYFYVGLQRIDNSRGIYPVHRLVATAFIPKTDEDIYLNRNTVNHINIKPYDNRAINLEWVTEAENNRYAILMHEKDILSNMMVPINNDNDWSNGANTYGENNGMCTISDEQVHIICKCRESGMSYKECAVHAGLPDCYNSMNVVSMICRGLKRTDISSMYNISRCFYPKQKAEYSIDNVHEVCKMIKNGYDNSTIVKTLHLNSEDHISAMRFVNRIRNKKNYIGISDQYF